jgi:hypothetical protein
MAREVNPHPLCVLTAADRDAWAQARAMILSADEQNARQLQIIDEAIIILSVDTEMDRFTPEDHAHGFLSGEISNRWFDKHQIIVHESSGQVGLNFEHSCSDGTNWLHFIQDCMAQLTDDRRALTDVESSIVDASMPLAEDIGQWLEFVMPETVERQISEQLSQWQEQAQNLDLHVLHYQQWGKRFAKEQALSPDALVQMAFQLAYFRLMSELAPTYESAQMRRFFTGRTDTIRSCSAAAKAFVTDWQTGVGSLQTLLAAVKAHAAQSKRVASGQGIDRHLLALETLAEELGHQVPLFEDALYKRAATWVLSTSNASDPNLAAFGFGPVAEHGFGLGYLIHPDVVSVTVTAFKSSGNSAKAFAESLAGVMDEFRGAFEQAPQKIFP